MHAVLPGFQQPDKAGLRAQTPRWMDPARKTIEAVHLDPFPIRLWRERKKECTVPETLSTN